VIVLNHSVERRVPATGTGVRCDGRLDSVGYRLDPVAARQARFSQTGPSVIP
jgi:hypothetical protein